MHVRGPVWRPNPESIVSRKAPPASTCTSTFRRSRLRDSRSETPAKPQRPFAIACSSRALGNGRATPATVLAMHEHRGVGWSGSVKSNRARMGCSSALEIACLSRRVHSIGSFASRERFADFEESAVISTSHVAEALGYRPRNVDPQSARHALGGSPHCAEVSSQFIHK